METTNEEKKSILIKLDPSIYDGLVIMADDEERSIAGQIVYLVKKAVYEYKGD